MSDAYNSHPKSVGQLVGNDEGAKIIVPEFQRGYSWEKKHVEAFWKDVVRHQKESASGGEERYFLGPIVAIFNRDEIVLLDGQQRLATATILFSVLRDIARQLRIQQATDFARDIQIGLIEKEDRGYSLNLSELDRGILRRLSKRTLQRASHPKYVLID